MHLGEWCNNNLPLLWGYPRVAFRNVRPVAIWITRVHRGFNGLHTSIARRLASRSSSSSSEYSDSESST